MVIRNSLHLFLFLFTTDCTCLICFSEKTHEKLFSGAHRSIDVNDNHMQPVAAPSQSLLEAASRFQPTQALLNSAGCLISPLPLSSCAAAGRQCSDFNGWLDCSSGPSLRCQSTTTCLPAASGQMCLDSNGQLTAPMDPAMDCDSDVQLNNGGVTGDADQGRGHAASARGGLNRFGFKSTKQASRMAGASQGKT